MSALSLAARAAECFTVTGCWPVSLPAVTQAFSSIPGKMLLDCDTGPGNDRSLTSNSGKISRNFTTHGQSIILRSGADGKKGRQTELQEAAGSYRKLQEEISMARIPDSV